jgi:hypothetical protein
VPLTFDVVAAAAPASSMVTPGILGFLVFAALAVALVFLLKSMNKQFRKITPPPGPTAASSTEDPAKQENPKLSPASPGRLSYPPASVRGRAGGASSCR